MNTNRLLIGLLVVAIVAAGLTSAAADSRGRMELTAEEMVVDDQQEEVEAVGNVVFTEGGRELRADKLVGRQNLEQLEASGNVVLTQNESRLTGEHLDLSYVQEQAIITGSPRLEQEDSVITGGRFEFDLATNDLKVTNGAHLEAPEQELTADADNLDYYHQKQEVVLTGEVRVLRGNQELEAPQVIVDLENRRLETKGQTKFVVPGEQGDQDGN